MDYGKPAATFLHLAKNKAVRISSGKRFYPAEGTDLIKFYDAIPDEEMFNFQWVTIDIKPEDLPGKPIIKEVCEECGETAMDRLNRAERFAEVVLHEYTYTVIKS